LGSFDSLLDIVPILRASWLTPANTLGPEIPTPLVPTHIKQVRTTAPKDMKVAKERRVKGRADAKKRTPQARAKAAVKGD
jgi:ribonuclease P/MRP protein subunit POP3